MTVMTTEISEIVTRLIEICHDGELGFISAANALPVDEPALKDELTQYSWQRRQFAAELQSELERLGEEAPTHGTVSGALHRGWMNLKLVVGGHSRQAVLTECKRGEEAAVAEYRQVTMRPSLPPPLTHLIDMQYQAVKRVHDRISELSQAIPAH